MNQIYPRFGVLLIALFTLQFSFAQKLDITHLSTYNTGIFDEGAAEIVAFDKLGNRLFFVNGDNKSVDVEAAVALDVIALGFKDHEKGQPVLQEYFLNNIPWYDVFDLGTPVYDGGETIKLGGFSGLCYDPLTSTPNQLSFWAVPDRGPNESTVVGLFFLK